MSGRRVADARVLDVDQAAAVGLQHVARVELREAVRAHDLPVRAARQHLAAHVRSLERAAEDGDDAAAPARHLTKLGRRPDLHVQRHGERELRRLREPQRMRPAASRCGSLRDQERKQQKSRHPLIVDCG